MRTLIRGTGILACLLFATGAARAQYQGQQAGAVQLFGNAGMNPYMNPYAAGLMPNNPDFLLYMYSANQANGGFGTGVMSGTRPGPGQQMGANGRMGSSNQTGKAGNGPMTPKAQGGKAAQSRTRGGRQPALMPMASAVPGSGAAGFFGRGFDSTGGAGRFYNRTSARFNNNGR
jgi:hypothetical protein